MSILKIITVLNWIVIAGLAVLVVGEMLSPAKSGGDAAGRGMGQAIYYLAIIALILLIGLNLLPFNWSKYVAFILIVAPLIYTRAAPVWQKIKRNRDAAAQDAKPIFEDPERDRMARAIRDGDTEKLKQLLPTQWNDLKGNGEVLAYAVMEANHSHYKPEEKMAIVRLLFDAGASLDSIRSDVPLHMAVADVGNADLLRLLLEHGADPNAVQIYFKRHILFEAIGSYQQPEATVRVLLDFGAHHNVTAVYDDDEGPITPLLRAAKLERWGVCVALLEKGADPDFKQSDGKSFKDLFRTAEKNFSPDGYSTQEDFDRLKKFPFVH